MAKSAFKVTELQLEALAQVRWAASRDGGERARARPMFLALSTRRSTAAARRFGRVLAEPGERDACATGCVLGKQRSRSTSITALTANTSDGPPTDRDPRHAETWADAEGSLCGARAEALDTSPSRGAQTRSLEARLALLRFRGAPTVRKRTLRIASVSRGDRDGAPGLGRGPEPQTGCPTRSEDGRRDRSRAGRPTWPEVMI